MENQEEKESNDVEDGKITTFASPSVLAAILDDGTVNEDETHDLIAVKEQEHDSERIDDSLELSLNDSLEFMKQNELGGILQDDSNVNPGETFHELTEQTDENQGLDFPKSSTPVQDSNATNVKKAEKPPKPRRPQHIIERNKEIAGRRMPAKSSYAQMHATKTQNKLNKIEEKRKKDPHTSPGIVHGSDSGLGNQSELSEESYNELDQRTYFHGHTSQAQHDLEFHEQENDLMQNSYLNSSLNAYRNHGPYYDVIQNSSLNYTAYQPNYSYQPTTYARGNQSATASLRQSHAMAGPVPPLYYNPLSTQSAPPGGYHRTPLIPHLLGEDSYVPSTLPNDSYQWNKIPEPSLHKKFSSEPFLAQSSSPSLQKMANIGRNSKASGSYSSLRQPFQYKPYTLKDYKNIAGSNAEQLAGGLGPNVDTDEYKEKMKKVSKQREYAAMLRSQHSNMKKQQEKRGLTQVPVKPKHVKEAGIKRQAALNYAKNVPKPKQMLSRKRDSPAQGQHRGSNADDNQDITILEILRMRHEKEKKEVDSIRKELSSKIRL